MFHRVEVAAPNNPDKEISKDAWNDDHKLETADEFPEDPPQMGQLHLFGLLKPSYQTWEPDTEYPTFTGDPVVGGAVVPTVPNGHWYTNAGAPFTSGSAEPDPWMTDGSLTPTSDGTGEWTDQGFVQSIGSNLRLFQYNGEAGWLQIGAFADTRNQDQITRVFDSYGNLRGEMLLSEPDSEVHFRARIHNAAGDVIGELRLEGDTLSVDVFNQDFDEPQKSLRFDFGGGFRLAEFDTDDGPQYLSIRTGQNSPEGVVDAPPPAIYFRNDGDGNTEIWTKSDTGSSGWAVFEPSSGVLSDTVVGETHPGQDPDAGAATDYARGDHTHGTPQSEVGVDLGPDFVTGDDQDFAGNTLGNWTNPDGGTLSLAAPGVVWPGTLSAHQARFEADDFSQRVTLPVSTGLVSGHRYTLFMVLDGMVTPPFSIQVLASNDPFIATFQSFTMLVSGDFPYVLGQLTWTQFEDWDNPYIQLTAATNDAIYQIIFTRLVEIVSGYPISPAGLEVGGGMSIGGLLFANAISATDYITSRQGFSAGSPGVDGNYGFYQGGAILAGTADPSAGAGLPVLAPALYIRNNSGVTELWTKSGVGDTDWTQV